MKEEGRELIYKGALKKRGNAQGDSGDLMVFLFDHALLMVKPKSKVEQYKVYRRVSLFMCSPSCYRAKEQAANTTGTSSRIGP